MSSDIFELPMIEGLKTPNTRMSSWNRKPETYTSRNFFGLLKLCPDPKLAGMLPLSRLSASCLCVESSMKKESH
jgi:hypothetical protein